MKRKKSKSDLILLFIVIIAISVFSMIYIAGKSSDISEENINNTIIIDERGNEK